MTETHTDDTTEQTADEVCIDMGWGRLVMGQTFHSPDHLVDTLCNEDAGKRDIGFYLPEPHVVVGMAPQELFLDPSHAFRLAAERYTPAAQDSSVRIVRITTLAQAEAASRIWETRNMVPAAPDFILRSRDDDVRLHLVAVGPADSVLGVVTGVDHVAAFGDTENGASLWALAVDPQAALPGIGEALVRSLVETCFARGRAFVDLSVMHDNQQAIDLYEKLGFERLPVFTVKRRNEINVPLFVPDVSFDELNPYSRLIIDAARLRSIAVEILDARRNLFALRLGGREILCRESLTELTSAIAFMRCDDKRLTHQTLHAAGLAVPNQQSADDGDGDAAFLARHGRIVVKPSRGEQGRGVSADLRTIAEVRAAVAAAKESCADVLLESFAEGEDLRIIVIDYNVVAAAVRRRPEVIGDGRSDLARLIEKYNRRRMAATGGESCVPLDGETDRALAAADCTMATVLAAGRSIELRRAANLHTGGTIHDVTANLHEDIRLAAVTAARALRIPVVGLDLMLPDLAGPEYKIIEANERPGLANHEPQPTAERFLDFLFPETRRTRRDEIIPRAEVP